MRDMQPTHEAAFGAFAVAILCVLGRPVEYFFQWKALEEDENQLKASVEDLFRPHVD